MANDAHGQLEIVNTDHFRYQGKQYIYSNGWEVYVYDGSGHYDCYSYKQGLPVLIELLYMLD